LQQTAILALEDGTVFQGRSYGARTVRTGEVVFNTSLTGYQEVFTDPSYSGQIVILTNPQIGNYGTNADDDEAARAWIEGLIVREWSEVPSNWRSSETADAFLARQGVPVASELDTRAIVRKLRSGGVLRGALSTAGHSPADLVEIARNSPSMAGLDLATRVSTAESYRWTEPAKPCSPSERIHNSEPGRFHVVAFDFVGALGGDRGSNVAYVAHVAGAAFALLYYQGGWNLTRLSDRLFHWQLREPKARQSLDSHHPGSDDRHQSRRLRSRHLATSWQVAPLIRSLRDRRRPQFVSVFSVTLSFNDTAPISIGTGGSW